MKKNLKKLSLKKETIYNLNQMEMGQLKGEGSWAGPSCEVTGCDAPLCNAIASIFGSCDPTPSPIPEPPTPTPPLDGGGGIEPRETMLTCASVCVICPL